MEEKESGKERPESPGGRDCIIARQRDEGEERKPRGQAREQPPPGAGALVLPTCPLGPTPQAEHWAADNWALGRKRPGQIGLLCGSALEEGCLFPPVWAAPRVCSPQLLALGVVAVLLLSFPSPADRGLKAASLEGGDFNEKRGRKERKEMLQSRPTTFLPSPQWSPLEQAGGQAPSTLLEPLGGTESHVLSFAVLNALMHHFFIQDG